MRRLPVVALALLFGMSCADAATLLPNGMQCFSATVPQSGGQYGPVAVLGAISGGSGYRDGVYTQVPLTGGSGRGATATVTVMMGAVTGVSITNAGTHYTGADTLSAASSSIGGQGTGFSVPVSTVTSTGTGMVGLLGPITAGFGGRSGTYGGVALTGGAGTGATANITVQGGRVSAVAILNPGASYQVGDILSAAAGSIGNVTGFSVPIASVAINQSLAGGSVYMFVPNTTTIKQTWQDTAQTILNQNPVTLDANGCAVMYGTGIYRQVLTDALGNIVWDRPTTSTDVQAVMWAGKALNASTQNQVILKDPGFNATDGSIVSFIPVIENSGATTITFQGTSYVNIPVVLDMISGPQPLMGGEIVPNNVVVAIYSASENTFHLINSAQAASLDLLNMQVQKLAAAFATQPTVQVLTGSGTYMPTVASNGTPILFIRVRMVGGGGGGGGTSGNGNNGGVTSFGAWTAFGGFAGGGPSGANGGFGGFGGNGGAQGTGTFVGRWEGGSGSGSGSISGITNGAVVLAGGSGGSSIFGGNGGGHAQSLTTGPPGPNTGGGGGGATTVMDAGGAGGGGAGEGIEFLVVSPMATTYAVGAGGAGGSGADAGAAGTIIVEEFYH